MSDVHVTEPTVAPTVAEPPASSYASGGFSAERVVVWILLLAALGFWIPYMIVIDHGMMVAGS